METRTSKVPSIPAVLPLEPVPNLSRAKVAATRPVVRVYRSAPLRPDEWRDIVAKGRRGL